MNNSDPQTSQREEILPGMVRQALRKEEILPGTARRLLRPEGSFSIRIDPEVHYEREIHKVLGIGTSLGICRFMQEVLKANENLPKYAKMSDPQIYHILMDEYPHSKLVQRLGEKVVRQYRAYYNNGGLVPKEGKPGSKSYRYTTQGDIANGYTGKKLVGSALVDILEGKQATKDTSRIKISKIRDRY